MIDVKTNRGNNKINTTLGELIATVSDFAFEYSADTRETYGLARLVLVELLKKVSFGSESIGRYVPGTPLLH